MYGVVGPIVVSSLYQDVTSVYVGLYVWLKEGVEVNDMWCG
jgi:hypothetical protein